jgi:hypothetical protein
MVDDEWGRLAVVVVGVLGLVVVQAQAAGWDVDLQALQTDVAHPQRIAQQSHGPASPENDAIVTNGGTSVRCL